MRTALRALLVAGVPVVAGRVFEASAVRAGTAKPCLVVREVSAEAGPDWGAAVTAVEVWPLVPETSFGVVDGIEASVRGALHGVRFSEDGAQYLGWFVGSEADFADAEWRALTRRIRFQVFGLGWLAGTTYAPDVVAAVRAWTQGAFPGEVGTDPGAWTPEDASPGVYWRLAEVRQVEPTGWGAWVEGTLRGHVVAPGPGMRLAWTRRLAEGLALARGTWLADGSWLEFVQVSGTTEVDAMRQGQIGLVVRWGVLGAVASPGDPVLEHAYAAGDVEGSVHASAS